MAGKPIARVGDTGSHGGSIISGDDSIFVNGRPVARVGDMYACPEHGTNPIITGAFSVFGKGQLVAHVGSMTSCGANITSGSPDTFVDEPVLYAALDNIVTDAGPAPKKKDCVPPVPGPGCDKPEFFALYCHFKMMADELGIDVDWLMAQAADESSWGKSDAAKKNNLFGVNRRRDDPRIYRGADGKRYGTNEEYDTLEEGIGHWMRKWGPYVKNAKTHEEYVENLLKHGYNEDPAKYRVTMKNLLESIQKRKKKCGVTD